MPGCSFATAFYNQNLKKIIVSTFEGKLFELQI